MTCISVVRFKKFGIPAFSNRTILFEQNTTSAQDHDGYFIHSALEGTRNEDFKSCRSDTPVV